MRRVSDETKDAVLETIEHLHENWRRGYRGGEIFAHLPDSVQRDIGTVTDLCYLLKDHELNWDVDWVDVMLPGRQNGRGGEKESLVTIFFSMRDETEERAVPALEEVAQEARFPFTFSSAGEEGTASEGVKGRTRTNQYGTPSNTAPGESSSRANSPVPIPPDHLQDTSSVGIKPEGNPMIQMKEAPVRDFVTVTHEGTATDFLLHKDDVSKLNTPLKVGVFELPFKEYFMPDDEHPTGRYVAKTRIFVASYLLLKADHPVLPAVKLTGVPAGQDETA